MNIGAVMSARILVTGSRDWTDWRVIDRAMSAAFAWLNYGHATMPFRPVLVHGAARGADTIAAGLARLAHWDVEGYPADWDRHGKAAGPIRNAEMVALGADICLAFPFPRPPGKAGTSGTEDCYTRALAAGIPTWIFPGRPE